MREKQKSKKITLIVLLLLLVLVSSAFIGTLARYITSGTIKDDAVVAKFGLNIPTGIDLFSDSYTNVDADTAGKKIIAPGTSGQYKFNVTGTSEVAYIVRAEIEVTYSDEWNGYKPLQFSIDGNNWTDIAGFKSLLGTELASEKMSPNAAYSNTQTIYWKWPFNPASDNATSDASDTTVGIAAATGTAPKVTVEIQVIAEQLAG